MKNSTMFTAILAGGFLSVATILARPIGHQGVFGASPDWSKAYNTDGIRFVFIKCTEGTTYVNNGFQAKLHGAQAVNIYAGCYHRCNPVTHFAEEEAMYFWNNARAAYMADVANHHLLSPALDLENELVNNGGGNDYNGGPGKPKISLSAWASRWYNYVASYAAADGITLAQVVYVNAGWPACDLSNMTAWSWVANPCSCSDSTCGSRAQAGNPWTENGSCWQGSAGCYPFGGSGHWRIWQYQWNVQCDYSNCQVGLNVYNGTVSDIYADIGAK